MQPSAPRASAAATPPSTSSWAGITSATRLFARVEHPYGANEGRRATVRHGRHLPGLALATVERATQHPGGRAAHRLHGAPEVRRCGLVRHILDLSGQFPPFNPVE